MATRRMRPGGSVVEDSGGVEPWPPGWSEVKKSTKRKKHAVFVGLKHPRPASLQPKGRQFQRRRPSGRGHFMDAAALGSHIVGACRAAAGSQTELTDEASCDFQGLQIVEGNGRCLIDETKLGTNSR